MRRALFAIGLTALLVWAFSARALYFTGYDYPSSTGSFSGAKCASPCTEAQINWVILPETYSGSGGPEGVYQWLGFYGSQTTNCIYAGVVCLDQFGTYNTVQTDGVTKVCNEWYQQGPNGGITSLGMPCAEGDHITAHIKCFSNCTPYNASMTIGLFLTDKEQGWTWVGPNGGTPCSTGVEANCLNWPVGLEYVEFIAETGNAIPNCNPSGGCIFPGVSAHVGPIFYGAMIGMGGSPMQPLMLSQAVARSGSNGTGASKRFSTPSGPMGIVQGDGPDFDLGQSSVSNTVARPANSAYQGKFAGSGQ
jgi:hypothetical protein